MAKVVITIEDRTEGIHLVVESDPDIPMDLTLATDAQYIAALALEAVYDETFPIEKKPSEMS